MKVIDLTHTISEDMPVYPGTEQPKLKPANSYEKDGFKETLLCMYSHTRTHVDPTSHLYAEGTSLDALDASRFVGRALKIDCRDIADGEPITMAALNSRLELARQADFLLFNTGWDKKWGSEAYFGDYPCIADDVVDFILSTDKKGIGFDVIGVDPIADSGLVRHRKLFKHNEIVNIENLKDLDKCPDGLFWFFALPLKWKNADGAPIRAIAFIED